MIKRLPGNWQDMGADSENLCMSIGNGNVHFHRPDRPHRPTPFNHY
jgi:hypothetical protein